MTDLLLTKFKICLLTLHEVVQWFIETHEKNDQTDPVSPSLTQRGPTSGRRGTKVGCYQYDRVPQFQVHASRTASARGSRTASSKADPPSYWLPLCHTSRHELDVKCVETVSLCINTCRQLRSICCRQWQNGAGLLEIFPIQYSELEREAAAR